MAVAAALLVGLVADELVDDALVDAGRRQARDEAVPQDVVALQRLPLAPLQGALQMVVRLVPGHRRRVRRLACPHCGQPSLERRGAGLLSPVSGRAAALLAPPDD